VPHERLGEEVAAAVVLVDGASADERELREHASKQLADFKTPKRIIILEDIPKGATGKVQRIGLAEKLGLG
jgi:acyl-CoA synthetase (AMP-forming)/AMP-acid ligase II